jgi:cystathionine gamma-synthase
MPGFKPLPLGRPIPDVTHAVSCSLPTMEAVRGYEEKRPEITSQLTSGYPRFVLHPYVLQLTAYYLKKSGYEGLKLWLTSSEAMAEKLEGYLVGATNLVRFNIDSIFGVAHIDSVELNARAKGFLQHVGGFISSRQAEDQLVSYGIIPEVNEEILFSGDSDLEIKKYLLKALPAASVEDLFLTNNGMNAIYSAFMAISEIQTKKGKKIWIQLGWLYLDTIAILKKLTPSTDDYIFLGDVFDLDTLKKLFAEKADRIAGVITEIPSNPLVQTSDVKALSDLCKSHDISLVLDTSITSLFSVKVLQYADVQVNSLTKYTASEGDVIAGLAIVNPEAKNAKLLRTRIAKNIEGLYSKDSARLAAQITNTEKVLAQIAINTTRIATYLEKDPRVLEVFWALAPESKNNYLSVAQSPASVGSMISFTLAGSLDVFYDRLALPKGPSFGMKTTLICPFMYLAHYDMVTKDEGRKELFSQGINPDLLRLSVGAEPSDSIIAALNSALG